MERQQRRRQPGVGFTHKNSKDLLPLDMRVGTSKDAQPHALVKKKQVEDGLQRLDVTGTGDRFTSIKESTDEQVTKSKNLPVMVKCQSSTDTFEALIDTGSRYTIISTKRAEKCGLLKSRNHGGSSLASSFHDLLVSVKGQIEGAQITLGGCSVQCDLLVTDEDKFDLLIGLDTLRTSKAVIDLERGVLLIGEQEISLMAERDIPLKHR
ncbi:nuclear receptor-interacting protein 3-like [Ptychodera flava]|uniref:nuclear receptor-interacting protein 3-like n=1 Tax=Ptychodera flava TaxID=63121 RepID=UPI00396A15FA